MQLLLEMSEFQVHSPFLGKMCNKVVFFILGNLQVKANFTGTKIRALKNGRGQGKNPSTICNAC